MQRLVAEPIDRRRERKRVAQRAPSSRLMEKVPERYFSRATFRNAPSMSRRTETYLRSRAERNTYRNIGIERMFTSHARAIHV